MNKGDFEKEENMEEYIIEIEEEYSSAEEDVLGDVEHTISAKEILGAVHKLGIQSKITIVENRSKKNLESEQQNDTGYEDQSSDEELLRNESPVSNISCSEVVTSPSRPPFSLSPFLYDENPEDNTGKQRNSSQNNISSTGKNTEPSPSPSGFVPIPIKPNSETTRSVPMHQRNLPLSFWMEPRRRTDAPSAFSQCTRRQFTPWDINPHPPFNRLFRTPALGSLASNDNFGTPAYYQKFIDLRANHGLVTVQADGSQGIPVKFDELRSQILPPLRRSLKNIDQSRDTRSTISQQQVPFKPLLKDNIPLDIRQTAVVPLLPNSVPPYLLKYWSLCCNLTCNKTLKIDGY